MSDVYFESESESKFESESEAGSKSESKSGPEGMDERIRGMKPSSSFKNFVDLVEILRNRCPWDREQTHESLKDHLIEEAYEAVDAIENEDPGELSKELGDLLLQVVFHSKMAQEEDHFTIEDVVYIISEKLIRRHPHIFADVEADNVEDVARNWESIKMGEGRTSVLDGLPVQLPALIRAHRMQEKASNVGFDWGHWKPAFEKVKEEMDELESALDHGFDGTELSAKVREEFGDLLFSLVNISRLMGFQSEELLRQAGKKFERRFRSVELELQAAGKKIVETSLQEMDEIWKRIKQLESPNS